MYLNFIKRILDFTLALILIVCLSWFFLFILMVYILTWQFPVFFSQERIGKENKSFTLYKFRTLKAEHLDKRRFLWGDFLRFFSFDELPQLWNVLKGEMSLIGPRPLPLEYLPLMAEYQKQRHRVLPGITGWAQVNGRHEINWKKKFDLDLYYIKHVSIRLDVLILIKTIALLLSFKKDVSLNEGKFTGN
ncbi:MAG: sugar transferase [Bacteroidetes bacterium]|nr:sugar transferase [Bacteroidota bacterium]